MTGQTKVYLGYNLLKQGKLPEGALLIAEGLETLERCYGPKHPILIQNFRKAAVFCREWGSEDDASHYLIRSEGARDG